MNKAKPVIDFKHACFESENKEMSSLDLKVFESPMHRVIISLKFLMGVIGAGRFYYLSPFPPDL